VETPRPIRDPERPPRDSRPLPMPAPIRHVLFDFGDTLAREPFCTLPPPGVPDWEAAVLATYDADGLIDRWCAAEVTFDDVVERVAVRCGMTPADARSAMEHDWRNLRLNERTLAFARDLGRSRRAAIVTVNPDIFTTVITPHYGLDRDFPVIVTSWEERLLDKTELCALALDRLGAAGAFETALLVDNRADNVAAFRARGGQALLFEDDASFARAEPALRARLA
jgi:FMN phosphatase YigB (HAD superfamily)